MEELKTQALESQSETGPLVGEEEAQMLGTGESDLVIRTPN